MPAKIYYRIQVLDGGEYATVKYYKFVRKTSSNSLRLAKIRADGSVSPSQHILVPPSLVLHSRFWIAEYPLNAPLVYNRRRSSIAIIERAIKDCIEYEGATNLEIVPNSRESSPERENAVIAKQKADRRAASRIRRKLEKRVRDAELKRKQMGTPMFPGALDLADYKVPNAFPVFIQPKMDGCRIRMVHTMEGKSYVMTQRNLVKYDWLELMTIAQECLKKGVLVEGEFWDPTKTWQQVLGLFLRKRDSFMLDQENTSLRITLFDCIDLSPSARLHYKDRYKMLKESVKPELLPPRYREVIEVIANRVVRTESELDDAFNHFVDVGKYEGAVIRNPGGLYIIGQRMTNVAMKRKRFMDAEFRILDLGIAGDKLRVELELSPERRFGAIWPMSHSEMQNVVAEKQVYIGKMATVKYTAVTDSGIPRSGEVIRWGANEL
jgi:hypothetical protein